MEWHKRIALLFASLFITMGADAYAVTVTIHDVYVNGNTAGDPVSNANGCVAFTIGAASGTDYDNLTIKGADGVNPARILAIENGVANCFLMQTNSRDRLMLVNTRIIPKATGVNVDLTLEYRGDFGPTPNGSVVFGGYMKGKFLKKVNGVYQGVTCTGNTPPNGPCKVTYETGIVSQVLPPEESPLPLISTNNPLGGAFNVMIPASTAIDVGTFGRGHHAIITTKLPTIDHALEIRPGEFVILGPPVKKHPHPIEVNPAAGGALP